MDSELTAKGFVRSYLAYTSILETLGYEVDEERVVAGVSDARGVRGELHRILTAHRGGHLNGELVEPDLVRRVDELREGLLAVLRPALGEGEVAEELASLDEGRRDELADVVALSPQRDYVKPRLMSVEEFQAMLHRFAGDQTVARRKLILQLQGELARRGFVMSCDTIEERFRSKPAVRTMPYCVKQIFKGLGDEFRTGLVPIEQMIGARDADQWLAAVRSRLRFRSQSAMHKALSEATGLTYDCIHKALSGRRKAKRVQVEVKRCLERWVEGTEAGRPLDVDERYLGISVERMCELMPGLLAQFGTKEAVYRRIARLTGLRTGSIRRYFQNDGQLKYAPLAVCRTAQELASQPPEAMEAVVAKGGAPAPERRAPVQRQARRQAEAVRLAGRAEEALRRWRGNRANGELKSQFKDLRRALIAKLKERRSQQPVGA